jgi:SAM-dependent methyltransferase
MSKQVHERVQQVQSFFGSAPLLEAYGATTGYREGERYLFDTFLRRGGSLLDCGCGTGRTSFLLAGDFDDVHAFDITAPMIEFAEARQAALGTSINFFVGDATELPFDRDRFDNAIFAYNGVESIASDALREQALREIHRVLAPGGRFVFSTKSCFNWDYVKEYRLKGRVKRLLARAGRFDPQWATLGPDDILHVEMGHTVRLHTTNPLRMTRLLRRIGFRVLYFNSEVRLARGEITRSPLAYLDPWDHYYACEKRA